MAFSYKLSGDKILFMTLVKSLKNTCERIYFSNVAGA